MATTLMLQLESFHRPFLPLGQIGVLAAMLPSRAPLGFVAMLGVLALIGILIRNSVVLIVQIEELRAEGRSAWEAKDRRDLTGGKLKSQVPISPTIPYSATGYDASSAPIELSRSAA